MHTHAQQFKSALSLFLMAALDICVLSISLTHMSMKTFCRRVACGRTSLPFDFEISIMVLRECFSFLFSLWIFRKLNFIIF